MMTVFCLILIAYVFYLIHRLDEKELVIDQKNQALSIANTVITEGTRRQKALEQDISQLIREIDGLLRDARLYPLPMPPVAAVVEPSPQLQAHTLRVRGYDMNYHIADSEYTNRPRFMETLIDHTIKVWTVHMTKKLRKAFGLKETPTHEDSKTSRPDRHCRPGCPGLLSGMCATCVTR